MPSLYFFRRRVCTKMTGKQNKKKSTGISDKIECWKQVVNVGKSRKNCGSDDEEFVLLFSSKAL